MAKRNPLARDLAIWTVTVAPHKVYGSQTYEVERQEYNIGNMSEFGAKMLALRWAQSDAGVPPWKPYRRQGWKFVKAKKRTIEVVG